MAALTLMYGSALAIHVVAVCVIVLAGSRPETPAYWRRASVAFAFAGVFGTGASGLLLNPAYERGDGPWSLVGGLLLMEAIGLTWGALTFRSGITESTRTAEVTLRADSIRDDYADGINAAVVTTAADGTLRHMNRYALELLGLGGEEIVGKDAFDVWGTEGARVHAREEFAKFCRTCGRSGGLLEYEIRTTGGLRTIRWTRSAVLDRRGDVVQVISYGEDVTEQRRTEDALRTESYLLDSVDDSVIVTALDGRILYVNQAAHTMRGYARDEFLALEPLGWIAPEDRGKATLHRRRAVETGSALYEVWNIAKDGRRFPVESKSQPVTFDGIPALMNVGRDISARRKMEELLSQMAFDDALTGLPNRRRLSERLKVALAGLDRREVLSVTVFYIDCDNLKAVNDTAGHDAGDQLIKITADRLSSVIREGDTLGRVGGDEFVLVVPDLAIGVEAEGIARRMLELASEAVEIEGVVVRPSASIGICHCTPGLPAAEALKRADRAMYVAKKSGGGGFRVYDESMESILSERFRVRSELAGALESGELELHYQIMAETASRQISGVEALIRWRHPVRGLMMPDEFIEVAEESSLIVPIGRWVLLEACTTLASWHRSGLAIPMVAVNLSSVQLMNGDLFKDVTDALAFSGLSPSSLMLEITETAAMDCSDAVVSAFTRLKALGVGLALDDFGTGHSSLERLRDLPITTLKIDRSFISDLCAETESHPIIDTIIVLCSKLGLKAVAEGVEKSCQLDYLRRIGCRVAQGYIFARPCDAAEIVARMAPAPEIGPRSPRAHRVPSRRANCADSHVMNQHTPEPWLCDGDTGNLTAVRMRGRLISCAPCKRPLEHYSSRAPCSRWRS